MRFNNCLKRENGGVDDEAGMLKISVPRNLRGSSYNFYNSVPVFLLKMCCQLHNIVCSPLFSNCCTLLTWPIIVNFRRIVTIVFVQKNYFR
jgi:hypothetical protein